MKACLPALCLLGATLTGCASTSGGQGYRIESSGYATQTKVRPQARELRDDPSNTGERSVWAALRDVARLPGYAGYEILEDNASAYWVVLMRADSEAEARDKVEAMSLRPDLFGVRLVGPAPPELVPIATEDEANALMMRAMESTRFATEGGVRAVRRLPPGSESEAGGFGRFINDGEVNVGWIANISLSTTPQRFAASDVPVELRYHPSIDWDYLWVDLDEPAMSAEVAPLMRAFEVSPQMSGIVLTSLTTGYLRLQDGCIVTGRKAGPRGRETAVILPRVNGLRIRDGYVEIYNRLWPDETGARLGQTMGWGDGTRTVSDTPESDRLRRACGASSVVAIGSPSPYPRD